LNFLGLAPSSSDEEVIGKLFERRVEEICEFFKESMQ